VAKVFVVDVEQFHDFSVVVAENREVEVVVLRERFVSKGIVDAYSYDLGIYLVQLLHVITQSAHFTGAYGGERSWEEGEKRCTVGFQKLLNAARLSISVGEHEVRSFFALVDHCQSSWASV